MSDYKGSDKAGPAGLKGVAEGEEDPYLRKELGKLELRQQEQQMNEYRADERMDAENRAYEAQRMAEEDKVFEP